VLALLPSATDNILAELETERITFELQQQKAAKLARNGEPHPSELGSGPPSMTDDDSKSMASLQSESGVHASQIAVPSTSTIGEGAQDGKQQAQKGRKTKLQLWNDLKISGKYSQIVINVSSNTIYSNHSIVYLNLYSRPSYSPHSNTAQSSRSAELSLKRRFSCDGWHGAVDH
jgi:peroxin-3